MKLSYTPSETGRNKEVIAHYFCSEVKSQTDCSDWQASLAPAAGRRDWIRVKSWYSMGSLGDCDTVMHLLYFDYSLFSTVRVSQFYLWTNGSEKYYIPRFIHRKSLGWSWKKIPGTELCLLWNLSEKLLTKHHLGNSPDSRDKQPRRPTTVSIPHSPLVRFADGPHTRCLATAFPSVSSTCSESNCGFFSYLEVDLLL